MKLKHAALCVHLIEDPNERSDLTIGANICTTKDSLHPSARVQFLPMQGVLCYYLIDGRRFILPFSGAAHMNRAPPVPIESFRGFLPR